MGEISIKITIADRSYPLSVKMEEEETIRRAQRLIEQRMKEFQDNYAVRDKQDLLAMALIDFATLALQNEKKVNMLDENMEQKIADIDAVLSRVFNS